MNLFVCVCFNVNIKNPSILFLRTLWLALIRPRATRARTEIEGTIDTIRYEIEEGNERLRDLEDRGADVNGLVGISMDEESAVTVLMRSIDPTGRAETGQGTRETLNVSTTSQTPSHRRIVYIPCTHTYTHTAYLQITFTSSSCPLSKTSHNLFTFSAYITIIFHWTIRMSSFQQQALCEK